MQAVELLEYWRVIRKRLWFIVLLMLISAGVAAYVGYQQEPQYRATATLFINPVEASPVLPLPYYQTREPVESLANTYTELLRTHSFAQLVGENIDQPLSESEILNALSARYVPDTQFFRVTATHTNRETAQVIANAASEVLVAEEATRRRAQRVDPVEQVEYNNLLDLQATLQAELEYHNSQIASIESQLAELEETSPPEGEVTRLQWEQTIRDLRSDLSRFRSERVDIFTNLTDTQIAIANLENNTSEANTAAIVDPARLPDAPLPLQIGERIIVAALAALVLGVGLSFLIEYVDYTVKTPEQLSEIYNLPVQGTIGALPNKGRSRNGASPLITVTDPLSPNAEAFRGLRTSIQVAGLETPVASLLITSAKPHEGKTFVASNLAVSLAQNGSRVILVDTDLRRPGLHKMFDLPIERGKRGFTNVVVDRIDDVEAYLYSTHVENLRVLPSGTIPPNPAELLGSSQAAGVMHKLKELADIVIYDSSPAGTVTDPLVLAPRVDGVLQIVWMGVTRIDAILRCKSSLNRVGATLLGTVLNAADRQELGYTEYYNYYLVPDNGHGTDEVSEPKPLTRKE